MAQLKDLLVNGSSRFIGDIYGNLRGNADTATKATNADHATKADTATKATSADSATTATTANNVKSTLTIKMGSTTIMYNGSSAQTATITPSAIGAAASNHTHTKSQITDFAHNHDERYYTESEIDTKLSTLLGTNNAMVFKGAINKDTDLPVKHSIGWTYWVNTAGTYASKTCEVGDLIICITAGDTANKDHWIVAQTNIVGAVTGPNTSTVNAVSTFADATGKVIKDNRTVTIKDGLFTAPYIATGTDKTHYFQSAKFRGEGNADTYYHAIDFGYSGHNQVDFHEYGGIWNFYENTKGTAADGKLVASIKPDGFHGNLNGNATSANKVNNNLVIKLNNGTTEGTNQFTYNGSATKNINITPANIGASASSHNHDNLYVKKSGDTMTGLLKTNGSIENQGEAKFTHPDYCPDIEDTAENIGCAFKASRGHFNQMNVNEIYLPATTTTNYEGNKISFKTYSGGNNGAYANVSEVAQINTTGLKVGSSSIGTNGYITGTWLQTTSAGYKAGDFATIDTSGWIYKMKPTDVLGNIGGQAKITATGMLKGDGNGGVTAAIKGTDYNTEIGIVHYEDKFDDVQAAYNKCKILRCTESKAGIVTSSGYVYYTLRDRVKTSGSNSIDGTVTTTTYMFTLVKNYSLEYIKLVRKVGSKTGTTDTWSKGSSTYTPSKHASKHKIGGDDPITPSDIGAAASSHSHNYLPLSGGTVTGEVAFTNANAIRFVQGSGTTKSVLMRNDGSDFYILTCNATSGNSWYIPNGGLDNSFRINLTNGFTYVSKLYGAVWNDYAEFRNGDTIEPGKCVIEVGNDTLITSTERLMPGANITSDTFGFAIGETEQAKTPIAVSGRVLAYPYESREEFKKNIGRPVCSGPNGTVSIMTDEEYRNKGYCAIGTISAVPDYEEWGTGKVKVNGRVWIKVF